MVKLKKKILTMKNIKKIISVPLKWDTNVT